MMSVNVLYMAHSSCMFTYRPLPAHLHVLREIDSSHIHRAAVRWRTETQRTPNPVASAKIAHGITLE